MKKSKQVLRAAIVSGVLLWMTTGALFAQDAPSQQQPAAPASQNQQAPNGQAQAQPQPGQPAAPGSPAQPPAAEKKPPMAKSKAELDAYQKFMHERNPDTRIHLIEDFLLQYPNSELKEYAYQAATQAYQEKNDYQKVLTYGELTLAENPNNLVALLILASAIPERTGKNDIDKDEKLAEAEQYANRGLQVLSKMTMPPNMTQEQWTRVKKDAEATPHEALGTVALIREDFPKAESEFKTAIALASHPDAITLYRLGLCYSFEKKYDSALDALNQAAASGGVRIPGPNGTRDLVAEAKDFVTKAKEAAATPVSGDATQKAPATGASATAHP